MEEKDQILQQENPQIGGALDASLARSNKQIRQERGDAIAEDLQIAFERELQDVHLKIKRLKRAQTNAIDFSPTNAQSLVIAKDIDIPEVKDQILTLQVKMRNEKEKLEEYQTVYEWLFGNRLELK